MLRYFHITLSSFFFLIVFADVDIKLKPLVDPPITVDEKWRGMVLFFEPYLPSSPPPNCSADPNRYRDKICVGSIPIDISSSSTINFYWDATDNNSNKYISINGNKRTKIEFLLEVDCDLQYTEEVRGNDITFEIDDSCLDSIISTTPQKYEYEAEESFVILGNDGSASCKIFTRLVFGPKDGVLDLNMKSIKISANYNSSKILLKGEHDYEWTTDGYSWMRRPEDGGTCEIRDHPACSGPSPGSSSSEIANPPSPDGVPDSSVSKIVNTNWATALFLIIVFGINTFF